MDTIVSTLLGRKEIFMSMFIAIFTIAYSYIATYFLRSSRVKRDKNREMFSIALLEGLKNKSISTLDDMVNIYKGTFNLGSEDVSYHYGLSRRLRRFLVELVSKNIDKTIDDQTIIDWKEKISEFIRKNDEISPYADLPAAERNILSDISAFVESNDTESTKRKLIELAGMIQARNDDLNKIKDVNKWAVPLAIIGMILTILFGFLAIFKK